MEVSMFTGTTEAYDYDERLTIDATNLAPSHSDQSDNEFPLDFVQMSDNSRNCVIAYSIIFLIAATGNLSVFFSVCRQMKKFRTRLSILILHLSVADLIVTFFLIPMEIFWRISVQWLGGNILCKVCMFFRAFGLYLSSMIIICISLDRFFAILFPLKVMNGQRRVKHMITIAWIAAIACSAPQSLIFSVKSHPVYTSFQQCVTIGFFKSNEEEILYNVFSVTAMYFIPLLVIVFTYTMILWKVTRKTREQQQVLYYISNSLKSSKECDLNDVSTVNSDPRGGGRVPVNHTKNPSGPGTRPVLTLRRSDNGVSNITRARNRTLRLTIVIVIVFLLCATPYVFMTLWYMFDRESAEKVDGRIQDLFFMMAVGNSCVNPLIYGSYSKASTNTCCGGPLSIFNSFRRRPVPTGSGTPIRNNTVVAGLKSYRPVPANVPQIDDKTMNELRINLERQLRETLEKPSPSNLQKNLNLVRNEL